MSTDPVRRVAVVTSFALLLVVSAARAQPSPPPSGPAPAPPAAAAMTASEPGARAGPAAWRPRREVHVGVADIAVTGAAAAVAVGAAVAKPPARPWRGGVLFDEDVRDALRVESPGGRYAVRDTSDVGIALLVSWPVLVDALITAGWYRGRAELARNLALVSAETMAIAIALQGVSNVIAGRERPYGRLCGEEIPAGSVDCTGSVRYRSFFSGHTSLSFASAGLLCTHHLGVGLLGRAGGMATCIAGVAVATTNGLFRVMGDMHYASDVALGAVVGAAIGVTVPLLHLRRPVSEARAGGVEVRVAPVGSGLGVTGTF